MGFWSFFTGKKKPATINEFMVQTQAETMPLIVTGTIGNIFNTTNLEEPFHMTVGEGERIYTKVFRNENTGVFYLSYKNEAGEFKVRRRLLADKIVTINF